MSCCRGERDLRPRIRAALATYKCETAASLSKFIKYPVYEDDFERICIEYAGNITHINVYINKINERFILRTFLPLLELQNFDFTLKKGKYQPALFTPPIIINTGIKLDTQAVEDVDLVFNPENNLKIAIVILKNIFDSINI
jgi:hypothetical protein